MRRFDPFSDLLQLAAVSAVVSGELFASGDWAIRFPSPQGLKFFAMVKGGLWLQLGEGEFIRVDEGDVVLMNWRERLLMASAPGVAAVDVARLLDTTQPGNRRLTLGDGSAVHQIGGHVHLDPEHGEPLAQLLPPFVHIRASSPQAGVFKWLLEQLVRERGAQRPGHTALAEQLAQMLFVHALRLYLEAGGEPECGWLRAIADKRLLPALRCMHESPGESWTLETLARAAAMSRTSFAVHFKAIAGVTPLGYLTQWRMMLARRALREHDKPIAALLGDLGYSSESAFSHAFKREVGVSPAEYRNRARQLEG
ncbi:MAG: AraC family transcriptional regulator [Propionivibrio sp.]